MRRCVRGRDDESVLSAVVPIGEQGVDSVGDRWRGIALEQDFVHH